MEGTSALKRWIAGPTPHSSCAEGTWNRMNISNECLSLENSITYALYKYTPNFGGNELFLSLYNKIKAAFPFPPLIPPNEADNDTGKYSHETYGNYFHLVGSKATNNRAYFRDQLIADFGTKTWDFTFEPWPGKVEYSIDFKRADGSIINSKPFHINRRKVGDINDDGKVDLLDLSIMGNYWGHTDPPNPMTNIDGEAEVNILDLSLLAANFEG
jgi:hypothetical protein